ncbi:LamB/YcsF family protein, partial [Aeromonas caviae]
PPPPPPPPWGGGTDTGESYTARNTFSRHDALPISQPGALIESEEQSLAQTLEMVQHSRVRSITGEWAHVVAETVCLHGDGEHALDFARRLRAAFAGRNIQVSAEAEE